MADKVHKIHSLPDGAPWDSGLPPVGSPEHPPVVRGIDRVIAIQRPLVLAHLRSIRRRHPDASTADIIRMLERRYLAAVTSGGAAVGATAVIPGITTPLTLALSGVETLGFLESTALFAQSLAEVHGIPIENPDRARALVLTLMLGKEGTDLLSQLAGQAVGRGAVRSAYWGEVVTKTLPRAAVGPLVDQLKTAFIRHFAVRGGASWVGKALPFGIGAAVGGAGNNILGRRVLVASRHAFGAPPFVLPPELEPSPGSERIEEFIASRTRRVTGAVAGGVARGVGATGKAVGGAGRSVGAAIAGATSAVTGSSRRKRAAVEAAESDRPDAE